MDWAPRALGHEEFELQLSCGRVVDTTFTQTESPNETFTQLCSQLFCVLRCFHRCVALLSSNNATQAAKQHSAIERVATALLPRVVSPQDVSGTARQRTP